jgi:hypothetical protein
MVNEACVLVEGGDTSSCFSYRNIAVEGAKAHLGIHALGEVA